MRIHTRTIQAANECWPSLSRGKARWPNDDGSEALRCETPNSGWTTRLGDVGRALSTLAGAACTQEETDAAHRHEEELSGLEVELRALQASDPGMSLLTAVEYITPDPPHRIAHL
jgi:hypothetical protein